MNDTISRQAAIDSLDEQIALCNKALGSFDISMKDEYAVKVKRASLKAYRETLNVLPSAQPGEDIRAMCGECDAWNQYKNYPQPGWIPCSRELPKKDGDYLVTTHSGQIARYIFIGGSSEEYWRRCATAWMPLPTPYREGGQE